jgi:hypothetical protein
MGKKQKFLNDLRRVCQDKGDVEIISMFTDWMISIVEEWNCDFNLDDIEAESLIKKMKSFRKAMKRIEERQ